MILLWRLGLQHPLPSSGAFITILMLAIDPFAQQIIRYYDCNVPIQGQVATIPRTNFYTSSGTHVGAGQVSIPPEIQTVIMRVFFHRAGLLLPAGRPETAHSLKHIVLLASVVIVWI